MLHTAAASLEPLPTGEVPKVQLSNPPMGILFDVYGTLVISQSGEVGTVKTGGKEALFRSALEEAGFRPLRDDQVRAVHDGYYREIIESHRASKEGGGGFSRG